LLILYFRVMLQKRELFCYILGLIILASFPVR